MTNNNDEKGRKPQVWRALDSGIKYIPLSSLEKFIEENEKDRYHGNKSEYAIPDYEADGFNSALKLLKDTFISNEEHPFTEQHIIHCKKCLNEGK